MFPKKGRLPRTGATTKHDDVQHVLFLDHEWT